MKRHAFIFTLLSLMSGSVWSIEAGPSSPQQQETENWLQLQPRATAASPIKQVSTQTEREASFQRWLKNYTHEIPDFYEQSAGGKVSSGSSR